MTATLSFDDSVNVLKAIGEPTRLRLALLLAEGDLTVSDLVSILGQSQPRISRHLKLMVEAGIVSRYQEGAWAYFRLGGGAAAELARRILPALDAADAVPARDAERLLLVRQERAQRAAAYFAGNAAEWDRIRSLHVADAETEAALLAALGDEPFATLLDIGTGTGRMLELLGPRAGRALGIDASREMLAVARAKLDHEALRHVSVRQGDAYHLPTEPGSFDLVVLHHVLHFLDDPARALREAALALSPGGRLVVVEFAAHDCEFLRSDHAHLRLGFAEEAMLGFFHAAGLTPEWVRALPPADGGPLTVSISMARKRGLPLSAEPARSLQFA